MVISIFFAKLTFLLLRILKRGGTALPGKVALFFKKDILKYLSQGVKIICVTGTNGKTTTCALIGTALRKNSNSYFVNSGGANMLSGIVSAFIKNCSILGKCKKEYAVLECDENAFSQITKYINPKIIAVTNIFRDQLDRYGEIQHTQERILKAIKNCPDTIILLNGDCPVTFYLSKKCQNKIYTFSVDTKTESAGISDSRYCPVCNAELRYKNRIYAQLGDFYCVQCGYRRIPPYALISDISRDISKVRFKLKTGSTSELCSTSLSGIYNCYNFCCAAAVLGILNLAKAEYLSGFSGAFGRYEKFEYNSKTILLLLVKNPVGMQNCVNLISQIENTPDIAFALNDNSADGRDVSWIWDAEYSNLKCKNIYTVGTRSYDMALRLKYSGLEITDMLKNEDYKTLIDIIKNSKNDFVVFSNYTAMMNMRRFFINEFGGDDFWTEK